MKPTRRDFIQYAAGLAGAACVPLVALYAAAKRFEPPTLEEGFDEVREVRLGPEGFIIEP